MMRRIRKAVNAKEQGFTLVELLVVITIIGILAAIAIPIFLDQRKKGVDASLKSDLKGAATAAGTFISANPDSTDPFAAGDLASAGFRVTSGNRIAIKGSPVSGYCIQAWSAGGTRTNSTINAYFYDSSLGGLQTGLTSPLGGACVSGSYVTP